MKNNYKKNQEEKIHYPSSFLFRRGKQAANCKVENNNAKKLIRTSSKKSQSQSEKHVLILFSSYKRTLKQFKRSLNFFTNLTMISWFTIYIDYLNNTL